MARVFPRLPLSLLLSPSPRHNYHLSSFFRLLLFFSPTTHTHIHTTKNRDQPNNKHDTIDTTHFLRLQKGREYTIDFRMAGHGDAQLILYSNFLRSNLLIEDMPEPNPTPPTSIPTGCAGLVRNIMVVVSGTVAL